MPDLQFHVYTEHLLLIGDPRKHGTLVAPSCPGTSGPRSSVPGHTSPLRPQNLAQTCAEGLCPLCFGFQLRKKIVFSSVKPRHKQNLKLFLYWREHIDFSETKGQIQKQTPMPMALQSTVRAAFSTRRENRPTDKLGTGGQVGGARLLMRPFGVVSRRPKYKLSES